MGVVIYGSRAYGRVDAQGGEHAQTSFYHLDFVPILPRSSFWVTQAIGDQAYGFPIKLHLKSVAATYLRVWGVIGAVAAFVAIPGPVGVALGGVCAALSAWSWTWRSLRGKRARLASDFRVVVFGSRCPPELMTDKFRDALHHTLRVQWGREHAGRSPDEVAQHGTANAAEAITAYGLLHLGAVERGRAGTTERAAANRLIDGAHEPWPSDAGPYRGVEAAPAASLAAAVAARAQEIFAARPVHRDVRSRRWIARPGAQLAGLVVGTLISIGMAPLVWDVAGPAHVVTERELTSTDLMRQRRVVLELDSIQDPDWSFVSHHRVERVLLGKLGKHVVPIVIAEHDDVPGRHVVGELKLATNSLSLEPWRVELQRQPALDAITVDYVLDRTHDHTERIALVVGLFVLLGTTLGWTLWLRAWRARRRA